ncbi:MAG: hypothetical protein GF331_10660, partial [Chitinivibrionales bacterium]|nr:hypothetical protein [Chitinivibrionales bacterium]
MSEVLTLENDHLRFALRGNATMRIVSKDSDTVWESMPRCFQEKGEIMEDVVWNRRERVWADVYISRFRAEATDHGVIITVFGPAMELRGRFRLKVTLDDEWVCMHIGDIDEQLGSLVFPTPIRSASLVIPNEIGRWIKSAPNGMESSLSMQNNGLNMRWVGGLADDDDKGWMIVFDEGFADSGVYRNGLAASPVWVKSMGAWSPTRSLRYRFTSGGYVGMAKAYRAFAYDRGLVRSLREKTEACPAVRDLLGGRIVSMFQCSTIHAEN